MSGLRTLPLIVALLALPALTATAAEEDPDEVARIGSVAPSFGLYRFEKTKDDATREAVQLDDFCGMRPGQTTAVLVLFVDSGSTDDLKAADGWHRKFNRLGLEVLAVSIERAPRDFGQAVVKSGYRFPVLDDRYNIVARRYGVRGAPFAFLLNQECRVLGFSDDSIAGDSGEGLAAAIEAQANGQLSGAGPRFER